GDTEITYGVGKDGSAEVILVKTPRAKRGEGSARRALEQMVREADERGIQLRLNADPMDKGVSRQKLVQFYRSLGLVPSKGRNKDFATMAQFIRNPKPRQEFATGGAVKTGPLVSDVPGRTDQHAIDVPEGAYVTPSDIVSG